MHRLTDVFRQRWELVDVFTGVLAAGHAKAKLKVKTLEQLLSEIVPLNHPEILYRSVSDCELNTGRKNIHRQGSFFPLLTVSLSIKIYTHSHLRGSNLPQSEKRRGELVTDESAGIWVNIPLLTSFI